MKSLHLLWISVGLSFFLSACSIDATKKSRVDRLPYYAEASFTPLWLSQGDAAIDSLHTVSDFSFINQDGDRISQKTFKDKIYVTDFFFTTCPGICPKMTNNMALLQDTFKTDDRIAFLSHSVTPGIDSVSILKAYAETHGIISGKWHLVTGDQSDIYEMGRRQYFVEEDMGYDRDADEFLHTENFILVDKNKHIRGIYNGLNLSSIRHLISDINLLLRE